MGKRILIAWILTSLTAAITAFASNEQVEGGRLKDKKIIMIVPERLFHETTFEWLNDIFIREGAKVIIASSTLSGAYSAGGLKVKPDILIKDIAVDDLDALVFVGGAGCLQYVSDHVALKVAKEVVHQGRILGAIDQAPRILAEAGLLEGKNVTCPSSVSNYLKEKGAVVTDQDVERDGNIVTAIGPSTAKQFGEAIVSALS